MSFKRIDTQYDKIIQIKNKNDGKQNVISQISRMEE